MPASDIAPPAHGASDCAHAPTNPVLVEVTRGTGVESRHRGAVVVADADGRVVQALGDPEQLVFPRSAIKPLQALPLVDSGAAAALEITDAELALACSSHSGTARHTGAVARWLNRIACGESDLACGGHIPADTASAQGLLETRTPPGRLHDMCSGKHAGFLALARHLGAPVAGYETLEHPAQQAVLAVLSEMTGLDRLLDHPHGVDGCSAPALSMPLGSLATAMARLAAPEAQAPARRAACHAIVRAVTTHPEMLAGPGQADTEIQARAGGRALIKSGAEGVYLAALPRAGLGVALKVDDGAPRASVPVLGAVLRRLQALDEADAEALAGWLTPTLRDRRGRVVGGVAVRPAL